MGTGGFGIPGRWLSDSVHPNCVAAETGVAVKGSGREALGVWNIHEEGV